MEKKNQIIAEYLPYRFGDLEVEQKSQELKANNAALSPAIRMDSLQRLDVISFILEMYLYAVQQGHDVTEMTVESVIEIATGKKIGEFGQGGVVKAYNAVDAGLGKAVDVTVDGVRTSMNWLGQKLIKWTEKK